MALPTFSPDKVFLNGGGGRFASASSRRPAEVDYYSAQLSDPGSFVNGLFTVNERLALMKAHAAAGDMEAANDDYLAVSGFYREYAADTAKAYSMNPGNDAFLQAIWSGAGVGMSRHYDTVMLKTPYGEASASDMFGPNGKYKSFRYDSIVNARFDPDVASLMSSGEPEDEDAKRVVGKYIVDPIVKRFSENGGRMPHDLPVSQYSSLATQVRRGLRPDGGNPTDADRVGGVDGVSAVLGHIIDSHMVDSTAVPMYQWAVKSLEARRNAAVAAGRGDSFNSVREAHALFNAFESTMKELVPGGSRVPDSVYRLGAMTALSFVDSPDVDLNDQGVRTGLAEIASVVAAGERGGVQLIPTGQGMGALVKPAIAGYVMARSQGLDAPPDNFMTKLVGLHGTVSHLISAGWGGTPDESRADPTKDVGRASGVFQASSGFDGLDRAGIGLYKALVRGAMKGIAADGKSDYEAVLDALSNSAVRDSMVSELSKGMRVSSTAASGILDRFLKRIKPDESGALSSAGLERAVSEFAFESEDTYGKPELAKAKREAKSWYARNVGSLGKYYDELMTGGRLDELLYDPVFGYGGISNNAQREARISSRKQEIKRYMHAAAEKGQSPVDVLEAWSRQGVYYKVMWRGPDGAVLAKPPEDSRGRLDARAVPMVVQTYGDLDAASQPYGGVVLENQLLPTYGARSFTSSNADVRNMFRLAQAFLKTIYDKQVEAAAKAASSPYDSSGWGPK